MTMLRVLLACVLAAVLAGCEQAKTPTSAGPTAAAPPGPAATGIADIAAIDAALANPARLAGDREQDARRKAKDVLVFLGARPGMHVIDYFSGGGYYSELLSLIVGADGSVIAYNNEAYRKHAGDEADRRFAANRLPNVTQITEAPEALSLPPESLDAALFVLSYHDLYWRAKDGAWAQTDPARALARLVPALKRDAVVVVVDHVAAPGSDPGDVVNALHRIDPNVIKRDLEAAGLSFESESNFLHNRDDDLSRSVFDESIRGKTDRVVMRFVKK